ncbi:MULTISPECIES: erythromycin esterase family protein [Streptomyces]|uniref:Erythromycin esterase family protein n=1 Tax=Streptomyces fimbriatus TaxID=68197 RepID=A0ABW0D5U1_STRFI
MRGRSTHIGDARATGMAGAGTVDVGQLVRERRPAGDVVPVGFGPYEGTVMAADFRGARPRVMRVPPARPGSPEHRLHQAPPGRDALFCSPPAGTPPGQAADGDREGFGQVSDHRAIGVVHRPSRERWGNEEGTWPTGV